MIKQNSNLIIIAPTAPPEVCGVSDYAFKLGQQLSAYYASTQIGVQRLPAQAGKKNNERTAVKKWDHLLNTSVKQQISSDVILNYTPLSYSITGFPQSLIQALKKFRKADTSNRLFVFVHETWNGSASLKVHHKLKDKLAKWSVQQFVHIANGVLVLTQGQQQKICSLSGKVNLYLSLVGANILPSSENDGLNHNRIKGQWVVFGLAHTRLWALQQHLPLLKKLYQCGRITSVHSIGPKDDKYAAHEKALANEHFGSDFLKQLGVLSAKNISDELLVAEASIIGQTADSLRKSGTFAALAAHAIPVICEVKHTITDPPVESIFKPQDVLLNPAIFESKEGRLKQQLLHCWFWNTRSWKAIGKDIYSWMEA